MLQKKVHNGRSGSSVGHFSDPTSEIYKEVVEHGESGVLQSSLWKEMDLSSRDGSRLAIRLEKRGMIKRERMLEAGRWTYILTPARMPVKVESIVQIPCFTCQYENRCSSTGIVTPHHCNLLENWAINKHANLGNRSGNET